MKRILLLLAAFGAALSVRAQSLDELLLQLDATLSQADRYAAEKEVRIKTIENNIHSRGVSAEQRFQIYGQLYREYLTYNFDQASAALDSQEEAAYELGNRAMINEVLLSRAMINATGGLYLEASQLLQQIDTTIFTPEQQLEYWNTQQRFWFDYRDYLGEDFDEAYLQKVEEVRLEDYYVKMMVAWYLATGLAKNYPSFVRVIEERRFDAFTHNKAIQKAVESYRVSDEHKAYLKALKVKGRPL